MKKKYIAVVLFLAVILATSIAYALNVTLGWTAVADDGNDVASGPATRYDLRYSIHPITNDNFASAIQIPTGAPKAPGSFEEYSFDLPDINTHYYFAIKTYDEVDNESALSNLAEADFFVPAPVANLRVLKQ